jgi:hypothetical protein
MENRLLCYLDNLGVTKMVDDRGIPLYGFADNDEDLSSWRFPFPKPTKEQLMSVDVTTRKNKMRTKKIKDNELYPLLQLFASKMKPKIDIDDLIKEMNLIADNMQ